jgi:hypothetical protein
VASLCIEQENYGRAAALYEEAVRINETLLGPEHPKTARTREWLNETRLMLKQAEAAK